MLPVGIQYAVTSSVKSSEVKVLRCCSSPLYVQVLETIHIWIEVSQDITFLTVLGKSIISRK
jgi:hypothetical protein